MKTYVIARSKVPSGFPGNVGRFPEKQVRKIQVAEFLKESSAHRPRTEVGLVYTDEGLWGKFNVYDRYVRCLHTEFQQPVYQDACVEFFVQPAGARGYFNFEFNACGALLAGYVLDPRKNAAGEPRQTIPLGREDWHDIRIRASFDCPVEPEMQSDVHWFVEFFISFDLFKRYILAPVKPSPGWRANFYKCAENNSHPHWAAWAAVPELNFHLPEYFGRLEFEPD